MPDFVLKGIAGNDNLTQTVFVRALNIDHLIGQLHGRDNVQHIGRLADLLSFQKIEMVQAGIPLAPARPATGRG